MSRYTGNRKWKGEVALGCLLGLFLLLAVLCFTVYPGVRFSGYLSLCLAGLCLAFLAIGRWAEHSPTGEIVKRVLLFLLVLGLLLFGVVEGLLLSRGRQENDALPADAVILLGAGVNGETPSLILRSRVTKAAEYLRAHPETPAILSGGQGPGEEISEAECMRRELTRQGIPEAGSTWRRSPPPRRRTSPAPGSSCGSWAWTRPRRASPSSPAISTSSGPK